MNDVDFLNWIADRFVNVHGESPNVDFVQKLRRIAIDLKSPPESEYWCHLGQHYKDTPQHEYACETL